MPVPTMIFTRSRGTPAPASVSRTGGTMMRLGTGRVMSLMTTATLSPGRTSSRSGREFIGERSASRTAASGSATGGECAGRKTSAWSGKVHVEAVLAVREVYLHCAVSQLRLESYAEAGWTIKRAPAINRDPSEVRSATVEARGASSNVMRRENARVQVNLADVNRRQPEATFSSHIETFVGHWILDRRCEEDILVLLKLLPAFSPARDRRLWSVPSPS